MKTGYTSGGFENFNIGQLNFLKAAKARCDRLIVGVETDAAFEKKWQRHAEVPFADRIEIVRGLSCVDEVVEKDAGDDETAARERYKFNVLFVGDAAKSSGQWSDFAQEYGVEIVGIPRTLSTEAPRPLESIVFCPTLSDYHLRLLRFFDENRKKIDEWTSRLTRGMDRVSQAMVERFVTFQRMALDFLPADRMERLLADPEFLGRELIRFPLYFDVAEREEWKRIERDFLRKTTLPHWVWPEEVLESSPHMNAMFRKGLADIHGSQRSLCFIDPSRRKVRGRDVLDCGANCGDSALIFEEFAPRSIHAFEPSREIFENMKRVIAANEKEQTIRPVNLATGDRNGSIRFFIDTTNDGASTVVSGDMTNSCEVQCVTIDDYVKNNDLDVGLIKMDIEGAEYDSIVGATETIKRFKPNLIISIYHTGRDFFEIKPYLESLDIGYEFQVRQLACFRYYITEFELIAY